MVAVARTQGALEELDDEIHAADRSARPRWSRWTSAQVDGLDQLGLAIHQRFGRLDMLVHAAALLVVADAGLAHRAQAAGTGSMAVNLTATVPPDPLDASPCCAPRRPRAIFLTSSRAEHARRPSGASYGATKAAMENLVRTWADELETHHGPRRPAGSGRHAHQDARRGRCRARIRSHPARPLARSGR